jgi:hypothetical protein
MEAKNGSDFLMCQKKSDEGIFYEHHDDTSDSFCFLVKVKVYFSSKKDSGSCMPKEKYK